MTYLIIRRRIEVDTIYPTDKVYRKRFEGLKDFSKARKEFLQKAKELGIKVQATYVTLGRYDLITIIEAPDEKALLKLTASYVGPKGRTTTETLTAIPAEEFEQIIKTL